MAVGAFPLEHGSTNSIFSSTGVSSDRWIDLRMISTMRLVLASSGLFIVMLDPTRPKLTYAALISYSIYSFVISILSRRRSALLPQRVLHWLDLFWYMPLIALTGGSNSIFFFFLFFSILVASFGWGFMEGVRLTLVAAS